MLFIFVYLFRVKGCVLFFLQEKFEVGDLSLNIDKMVRVGSGIWFSCVGDTNLRLVHAETYNIIQEMDVGKTLTRLIQDGKTNLAHCVPESVYSPLTMIDN